MAALLCFSRAKTACQVRVLSWIEMVEVVGREKERKEVGGLACGVQGRDSRKALPSMLSVLLVRFSPSQHENERL
jgi:hypothetical protein